jgi:transglutaminase-like putative cysteine protease
MWSPFFARPNRTAPVIRPSLTLFFCLVVAFFLTILPHIPQLPFWVTIAVAIALAVRSWGQLRKWRLPSPAFCGLLALCLVAGIYLQFRTVLGRDAGTAFMAGLIAIKFYELRGPRDVAMIIFSSFFVTMSSLLYSQSLELFVYCLLMMWVLTALLFRTGMGDRAEDRLLRPLRSAGLVFFQALPLAIFLFFFFPRYHGLLQIGMDDSGIGLTDTVKPGSISRLTADDSIAMTVKITNTTFLPPDSLYWRAIVLWNYQHDAWTPGPEVPSPSPKAAPETALIDQEITIWPHFHKWLFALDYPVVSAERIDEPSGWSRIGPGGVLQINNGSLMNMERYHVTSASMLTGEELSPEEEQLALNLPDEDGDRIDPQVLALAKELKEENPEEMAYINAVLHYFRHNHFLYTDQPGPGGPNALATFLFKRRSGFCEHFASAFGVLMRLGGFPTRLVVGYQGAQYNPYKNLYIVKQANAHSWDEVWITSEKHWLRVDPTAIISGNDNLTSGAPNGTSSADENLSIEVAHRRLTFISGANLPEWVRRSILEMQWRRQEVEADWNDWIFSYDPQSQNRWMQALGFGYGGRYVLGLACGLATALCATTLALFMGRRPALNPVEKFYAKFCRTMARRGLPRNAWEGPLAYTQRLAAAFPEERSGLEQVGRIVAATRYGSAPMPEVRHELKKLAPLLGSTPAATAP